MKKSLFFLALALVALVSCDNDPKSEYTAIRFKESSVQISAGDTVRMPILWEPTSIATAPTCTWTSSDTSVATVDGQGYIAAKAVGKTTITASYKGLTAICQVEVKIWCDMINFVDFTLWNCVQDTTTGLPKFTADSTYKILVSTGDSILCRTGVCLFRAWDENVDWNTDHDNLEGAGYQIMAYAANPIIIDTDFAEGKWYGAPIDMGVLSFEDVPEYSKMCNACPGKMVDAQKFYSYLTDKSSTYTEEECITGSMVIWMDCETFDGYPYQGLVSGNGFENTTNGVAIDMSVRWLLGVYGFAYDEEGLIAPTSATDYLYYDSYYNVTPSASTVSYGPVAPRNEMKAIKRALNMPRQKSFKALQKK